MSTTVFDAAAAPAQEQKQQAEAARQALSVRVRSGANWFLWIAGLSIVNAILSRTGSSMQFIVGLGTTQVADAIGKAMAEAGAAAGGAVFAALVNAFMVALFVFFGIFARRRARWAFYAGMIVYGIDALLFVVAKDFLGIGFHAFVLFFLYKGLVANKELEKLETAMSPMAVTTGPPPIG